jgi:hypothetical protein
MQASKAKQAIFAQVAKAKLVYYKNKETYKIVIAFNVTETNKQGKFKFPVQAKCNFVSGDICYETLQKDTERVIAQAKAQLRTNNIVFVD